MVSIGTLFYMVLETKMGVSFELQLCRSKFTSFQLFLIYSILTATKDNKDIFQNWNSNMLCCPHYHIILNDIDNLN